MKINLNAIVTREQLEKMGIEKYMEISKKGKMERNYIIDHLPTITENILPKKLRKFLLLLQEIKNFLIWKRTY